MPTWKTTASVLAILSVVALFQSNLLPFDQALAQEAPQPDTDVAAAQGLDLRCKVFTLLLEGDVTLETTDATTEIGQWIAAQDGWELHGIDFEVGQKPTGFPQGYSQICLHPVRPVR